MNEFIDRFPDVNVATHEYVRLLGYPRGRQLHGRAQELADGARTWYAAHGRPWIYARRSKHLELDDEGITIDGMRFTAAPLHRMLRQGEAEHVIVAAVCAGPEIVAQASQAWLDEKPDEYFFLETYGSAVVEHLITTAGGHLCAWAEGCGAAVLPHYSPGYPGWDVAEQVRLVEWLGRPGTDPITQQIAVLGSGMLQPKKAQLAVFGITKQTERVRRLAELVPCETCHLAGCQYRRTGYRGAPQFSAEVVRRQTESASRVQPSAGPVNPPMTTYSLNRKALERWSRDRLEVEHRSDGSVGARFRYDGTTCANMGWPLAFDYLVELGPVSDGHRIISQRCLPAVDDVGHRHMCAYLEVGDELLDVINNERLPAGTALNDAILQSRVDSSAGCYCEVESRTHKWGLVFETIHFALAQRAPRGDAAHESVMEFR